MSRGLAFWVLMLVWLVWGLAWRFGMVGIAGPYGGAVLLFLLFALIGWQVFGPPLR
jgi:hypothetical protein